MDTIVIYHDNCADGFTSAWIANNAMEGCEFIGGKYGEEPPYKKVNGKHLYLLDFSYPESEMYKLRGVAESVTVIDHHKTAQEYIQNMIDKGIVDGIFNMNKSGALLTWEWFKPGENPPKMVEYVSDRDLWKFELPKSKEVSMYLFSFEYTFANWDKIFSADQKTIMKEYVPQGEAIERKHMKDVEELVFNATTMEIFDKLGDMQYPVINVPYTMASDACSMAAKYYMDEYRPQVGFSYYRRSDGKYVFSIRSRDGTDVSEMAKKYGGGGHRAAAGFVVNELPFMKYNGLV